MTEIKISENLLGKDYLQMAFDNCIKCSTCKYGFKNFEPSCPSGEKFLFESYWASGRIRIIRGLLKGDLEWNDDLKDPIFACTTCGNCTDSCQAPHAEFIVDIIESLRELAVKNIGPGNNQEKLVELACNPEMYNPYGEKNSTNEDLKKKYDLPDKAEWVYYIGCTSNYRQQNIRDATIKLMKKIGIDFTLIDEHCCTSPMLRTGQNSKVLDFMDYNVDQIKSAGATKVFTSCAGCYRTLLRDYEKFDVDLGFQVFHTAEVLKNLLDAGRIKIKSKYNTTLTYHDPCHLGRHMGIYEIPREVYKQIPGIRFVEMRRNRNHAWCCGAGGGVKIAYPDWSKDISKERLEEAKETGASVISSTCPFCKTNLSDANEAFQMGFEVIDLIELLSQLDITVTQKDIQI